MKNWLLIMDFRETLSTQLPPSRPDEPAGLRQDILDELNDHLVCAYHREILRGVDGSVARRRVLEQFGDPAAVACRLWLDAMRGKIMAQRVLIGTCVLVAVASLALVGIFWQQALHNQRLAALQAAEAVSREQEMLRQLRDMTTAIQHPRSPDWNRVQLSLREESADGPPLAGVVIYLEYQTEQNTRTNARRDTDEAGVADFGLLHPGDYGFNITRTWNEWKLTTSGTIHVQPGEPVHKQIICPASRVERGEVRVRCEWPADLENAGLVLALPIEFRYLETGPGFRWAANPASSSDLARSILLGPSNTIHTLRQHGGAGRHESRKPPSGPYVDLPEESLGKPLPPGSTLTFEIGNYGLNGLFVWRRAPDVEPGRKRFERLVSAHSASWPVGQGAIDAASARSKAMRQAEKQLAERTEFIELPPEYWQRVGASFVARSGEAREWTIPLPDELIQAVRDALKAEKAPKDKAREKAAANKENG
jgi:hypothetical protein